jgi:glycosyltransferase involved in cell wall biosynthesis
MSENIHLVHFSSGPGGIEVLFPVIIKNMPDRSFSAFVIRAGHIANSVYENVPVSIKYGSNRNIPAYFKILFYTIKNRGAIFHVFNIGPVFLLLMRLGGAKKIIYSIHGTIYWKNKFQKRIYRFLWKMALSGKKSLIANSEHSRSEFLRKIDPRVNIRVLYNPIDLNRFRPCGACMQKEEEILIIYSGRLEKGKNLQKWIEIASYVHADMSNTRFEIYGEGSLKTILQQQITALNADDFIKLKGFQKDIENAYRKADTFLFLSEYESFGNVVVESIMCGTPVITSPIPVMKEIFRDYPQFVLSEREDFKEQVLFKLHHLRELKKLATCARESFLKRFSVEQHIKSLKHIYSECE